MPAIRTAIAGGVGGAAVTGSSSTYSIRFPSTLAVSELMVLVLWQRNLAGVARSLPGWGLSASISPFSSNYWGQIWWKRATSTDVASRGVISSGANQEAYAILTFRPGTYDPDNPVLFTRFDLPLDYGSGYVAGGTGPSSMTPGQALYSFGASVPATVAPTPWVPSVMPRILNVVGTNTSAAIAVSSAALYEDLPSVSVTEQWSTTTTTAGSPDVGQRSVLGMFQVREAPAFAHQRAARPLVGWATTKKRSAAAQPLPADYSAIGGRNITPQKSPGIPVLVSTTTGNCDVRLNLTRSGSSWTASVLVPNVSSGTVVIPTTSVTSLPQGTSVTARAVTEINGAPTSDDDTATPTMTFVPGAAVGDLVETISYNVGGSAGDSRVLEETITANITTAVPAPHVWFAYRNGGLAGDTVTLYGRGLGASAAAYHSVAKGTYTGQLVPTTLPIVSWTTLSAQADALTANRKIDPGDSSYSTPRSPSTPLEVDVVQVTMPPSLFTTTARTLGLFVQGDGGASVQIPWAAAPSLPTALVLANRRLTGNTALRTTALPAGAGGLSQRSSAFVTHYVVEGGVAQGPPLYQAAARSLAAMGAYTAGAPSGAIPLNPGALRFAPGIGSLQPAPDLGTTSSRWLSSDRAAGASNSWLVNTPVAPYVEQGYPFPSRAGARPETAMIFDGTSYAALENGFAGGFSIYMTVMLHGQPNSGGQGLPLVQWYCRTNAEAYTTTLWLEGTALRIVVYRDTHGIGAPMHTTPVRRDVPHMSSAPVLIGWVVDAGGVMWLYVGDTFFTLSRGLTFNPSGTTGAATNGLRLARNIAVGPGQVNGSLDIVDLVVNPGGVDTQGGSMATLAAMDGIHGVIRR